MGWFAEDKMRESGKVRSARVLIEMDVLKRVFGECDRHDYNETGGRMVGHYKLVGGKLVVQVNGVIDPGPNARRTLISFFQDGEYQTQVFRRLEEQDPTIEHLGNWHTHHVNGYSRLSQDDIDTYRRIVNHEKHNLDFFYALLVTQRRQTGLPYDMKHYMFFRGDPVVYPIPSVFLYKDKVSSRGPSVF